MKIYNVLSVPSTLLNFFFSSRLSLSLSRTPPCAHFEVCFSLPLHSLSLHFVLCVLLRVVRLFRVGMGASVIIIIIIIFRILRLSSSMLLNQQYLCCVWNFQSVKTSVFAFLVLCNRARKIKEE